MTTITFDTRKFVRKLQELVLMRSRPKGWPRRCVRQLMIRS